MNLSLKNILIAGVLILGTSYGVYKVFFASACCAATSATTSGCTPSNCRGEMTKFGEAKVITDLRLDLISLKAEMEKSESPKFDLKSYDIHGIVGGSDDESLEIIVNAVKETETTFAQVLNHQPDEFVLPENKAKKVEYLSTRIEKLQKLL